MKVAFFSGNYNDVVDGVAVVSQRQVKALLDAGDQVRIYAPSSHHPSLTPSHGDFVPVPSIPIVSPYRLALGLPGRIRADLNQFRPDLIHVASPDWLGFSAQTYAQRKRLPCVGTFFTHYPNYMRYYGLPFLEKPCWWLLKKFYHRQRFKKVYVACQSLAENLTAQGIDCEYEIMPFGVDTESFNPKHRTGAEAWRAKLGIAPGKLVVLFVGRLVWEKGLKVYADVISQLLSKNLPVQAVVVGDGPAMAGFQKLLPGGIFLGKQLKNDLSVAFAASDLFLFPSTSETFGLVSLEAQAAGLPAIVANAIGSKDIVAHGQTGFICEAGNITQFTEACEQLIRDDGRRKQFSIAGQKKAADLNWSAVMELFVRSIHQTIGES